MNKTKNPKNLCIHDSYKIVDVYDIYDEVRTYYLAGQLSHRRTIKSYVKEWYAHNWLYYHKLFRSHTKDVDLNEDESLFRRVGYTFIWWIGGVVNAKRSDD